MVVNAEMPMFIEMAMIISDGFDYSDDDGNINGGGNSGGDGKNQF